MNKIIIILCPNFRAGKYMIMMVNKDFFRTHKTQSKGHMTVNYSVIYTHNEQPRTFFITF